MPTRFRVVRAALYAASVFLSFFLMLVFMTYNVSSSCLLSSTAGSFLIGIPHLCGGGWCCNWPLRLWWAPRGGQLQEKGYGVPLTRSHRSLYVHHTVYNFILALLRMFSASTIIYDFIAVSSSFFARPCATSNASISDGL